MPSELDWEGRPSREVRSATEDHPYEEVAVAVPTPSTEEHATVPARAIPDGAKAGGSGPDDEFLVALAKHGQNA